MKAISVALFFTILGLTAAQSGYRYSGPQAPIAPPANHHHIHHHSHPAPNPAPIVPQLPSSIYSPVQSPPLQTFNPSPSIPLQPPPAEIPLPAPQAPPQTLPPQLPPQLPAPPGYLPPTQGGAVQSFSQGQQQQQFGAQFGAAQLSLPIQQQQQQQFGGSGLNFPAGGQGGQGGGFQQNFQSFQQPRQQTAIITKDIYIHSAPEDQEETLLGQQLDNAPIRKNYRIVFIKAPQHNIRLAGAALKHAQNANEEKTVIYVLSKKPDLTEVQQQLAQAQGQQKSHKPEVYFIKYKTQEEAQRAQQEIQAQYDALGGSTHISDEGVAPLTSVGSGGSLNLGGGGGSGGFGHQHTSFVQQNFQSAVNYEAPNNKYLPIKKK
ncbi:alpha/beta-gliadin MM1 [Ceratitis capitata]|uniref:(Mediterranean fruit fly) hypothetical protein n=1 Tax=Ceratitis capitata TaxID=7213 RepID=A0A811U475_CERCA|nr:alpha/beta-gliadin MM1 [Ceratitis capitata]CAD6993501.1 unnamed protein product [Ceratitis capitata]